MKFIEWIYSTYPNPYKDGHYGLLHILSLVLIAVFVIASTIILRNRSNKTKRGVLFVLALILIDFELARRVINLCKTSNLDLNLVLKILLPRPGCAISCWLVVIAVLVNKKQVYNLASLVSVLCGAIFFVYPGAGYNNEYILFENLYSIVTHVVFFTTAICFITYGFVDFKYKNIWKDLIGLAIVVVYAFLEIYLLKIEPDPFYFMPNNDVQEIIGMGYNLYLPFYLAFVVVYVNLYYFIESIKAKKSKKN